jgi:hypothetical protein
MDRNYASSGIRFQVAQILYRDAPTTRVERSEIEVKEFAIRADIRAFQLTDVVALIDAANPVPDVRGPYKKREAVEISN